MANALYDVLREFNAIKGQIAATTTSTTTITIDSTVRVDLGGQEAFFDIPFSKCSFGCWINTTNSVGFPRIFSFGQYPSAYQAISIENDILYVWYNGNIAMTFDLSQTSYIGNWVWIALQGSTTGDIGLWIDGVNVISTTISSPGIPTTEMFMGSENAPNTYYDGLMAGIVFDGGDIDVTIVPTVPIVPQGTTRLLLGQGGSLTEQLTDLGIYGLQVINTNCTYSTESPYTPADGGSIKFGA
jgi:hypothetical protein